MRPILELAARLAALERRVAGMMQHGTVAEVNPGEGWVRLDLGPSREGPLLSPRIPYAQMAGDLSVHAPPSVGQQMTFIAPSGDIRQAVAVPMTWSDANGSPGDGADVAVTFGDVRIDMTGGGVTITAAGATVTITGDGVAIQGDLSVEGDVSFAGGGVTHNGTNIGGTHRHGGVTSGGSQTNTPS
jgi:phage baseplate assembly protein gpV